MVQQARKDQRATLAPPEFKDSLDLLDSLAQQARKELTDQMEPPAHPELLA
jgi:hypothetical protein